MRKTQSFLRVSLALLALWGILFAGCSSSSDDDGPPPPVLAEPISDVQVYSYPGGAAYAPGNSVTFQKYRGFSTGPTLLSLSTAGLSNITVNANGKLSFDLETETPADSALDEMNTLALYYFSNDAQGSPRLGLIKLINAKEKHFARLFYSDQSLSVAQTEDIGGGQSINFSLNLVKGWNWVIEKRNTDSPLTYMTSQKPDSSFKWYIGDFPD